MALYSTRPSLPIVILDSTTEEDSFERLVQRVYSARLGLSAVTQPEIAALTVAETDLRGRISHLLQSIEGDRSRSNELFHYLWTMMCVRRGLMRIVREFATLETRKLVLEEVKTGRQRQVARPLDLDPQIETLAVEALARILGEIQVAG